MMEKIHRIHPRNGTPIYVEDRQNSPGVCVRQHTSYLLFGAQEWPDIVEAVEAVLNAAQEPAPRAESPAQAVKRLGVLHIHTTAGEHE